MSEKIAYDENARWLLSDSQILGRIKKAPHEKGLLVSLTMPWGEEFEAIIEKLNAASATQFCELARSSYSEWKASQAAAQERQSASIEDSRKQRESSETSHACEVTVPTHEEGLEGGLLDPERIAQEIDRLNAVLADREYETAKLYTHRQKLMRVLNALEDASPAVHSVSGEEDEGYTDAVDSDSRKSEAKPSGTSDSKDSD